MRLNQDEMRMYEEKKRRYMLTTSELATMLNAKPEDVFKCSVGHDVHPEVCEAVRYWIK